ncbi:MAG TPA: hypothetical protein VKN18_09315 [Blastocatellia bacterium]|nr:hypothetical protein [Blastocatellia bacterium]
MMETSNRTVVTFQSDSFNTSEPKDYFINDCCFGDDLARWMIERLGSSGVETDSEPGQEDFGWYFNFKLTENFYCVVLGFRPGEEGEGEWVAWLERARGFVASVFGYRKREIEVAACNVLNAALQERSVIRNVRWHTRANFDRGIEDQFSEKP